MGLTEVYLLEIGKVQIQILFCMDFIYDRITLLCTGPILSHIIDIRFEQSVGINTSSRRVMFIQLMENILLNLEAKKCWKSFLKTQCRRNSIDSSLASYFTIVKMRKFYQKLTVTDTSKRDRIKSSVWLENELRAYQWLLLAFSGIRNKLIERFVGIEINQDQEQWQELSVILNKESCILEYEAIKMINESGSKKRKWENDETQLLVRIINKNTKNNKWNQIARELFEYSHKKYFRSGKQCRERWLNHLDPQKKHGYWEQHQDKIIVDHIIQHGKKWSEMAKKLGNHRTEHMVKNRFKTLMIRERKNNREVKNESELLKKMMMRYESENVEEKREEKFVILPLDVSECFDCSNEEDDFSSEGIIRIGKDSEIQQIVTPSPFLYHPFTPTLLNTPHPMPFFMNYSFNQCQSDEHLFLKNS